MTTYTFYAILQLVSHQLPERDIQALSQAIRGCIPDGSGGYNGYEPEIPGLEMVPVPGLKLEVYGTLNCEYFYKPDIYDVAGTLPVGRYEAVAQSVGCYGGFTWVTLRYKNAVYWTALLADRCFLLRA